MSAYALFQLIALVPTLILLLACASTASSLVPPVADGIWMRPAPGPNAEPTIGFKDSIRVALWPTRGPRGLIRVLAPAVFPKDSFPLVNFIAVEPIVNGHRNFSELEDGADAKQGKRMWLSDCLASGRSGKAAEARGIPGVIRTSAGQIRTLSAVINVEPFASGAKVQVQVVFREDRPDEVGFRVYAAPGSVPMQSCVLSATMGNYSRARLLWLKDRVEDSRKLWPDFSGDGFTEHASFPLSDLIITSDGARTAFISPSEPSLKDAEIPIGGWRFSGNPPTQYWRKYWGKAHPKLVVQVNGRAQYWKSHTPIPGGVSFENFEMLEPYVNGQETWFGVSLKSPEQHLQK